MAEALRENSRLSQFIEARREGAVMNHISPWESRNIAGPRDKFQDDLNAACRKHFEALKGDYEAICYRAGVDIKPDIEAYALFCDGVDSAFDIDFRMSRDDA